MTWLTVVIAYFAVGSLLVSWVLFVEARQPVAHKRKQRVGLILETVVVFGILWPVSVGIITVSSLKELSRKIDRNVQRVFEQSTQILIRRIGERAFGIIVLLGTMLFLLSVILGPFVVPHLLDPDKSIGLSIISGLIECKNFIFSLIVPVLKYLGHVALLIAGITLNTILVIWLFTGAWLPKHDDKDSQ